MKLPETTKEELDKLFYGQNLLRGFSTFKQKAKDLNLPEKTLRFYYDNQEINQLFKPIKPRSARTYIPITSKYPFQRVYFDTMFLTDLNITLVNCIDLFSKYGFSKSFRGSSISSSKTTETLTEFIDKVIDLGYFIDTIRCDQGKEYVGSFKKLCDDLNIKIKYTDARDKQQTSPIEAFNRTMRLSIEKLRSSLQRGTPIHVQIEKAIPDILQTYNNTKHSNTGYSPMEIINSKAIQKEVNLQNIINVAYALKDRGVILPGASVRLALTNDTPFNKLTQNWTKEIYKVKAYDIGKNRYTIEDKRGYFQDWQLQPINEKTLMKKTIDTYLSQKPDTEEEFVKPKRLTKDIRDVISQPILEGKRIRKQREILNL